MSDLYFWKRQEIEISSCLIDFDFKPVLQTLQWNRGTEEGEHNFDLTN